MPSPLLLRGDAGGRAPARRATSAIEQFELPLEPADAAPTTRCCGRRSTAPTPGIAEENIQARIRGNLLMALSNKFGWLVLTTGNKSEYSVGYTTLYGDMAGGFARAEGRAEDLGLPARPLPQRAAQAPS